LTASQFAAMYRIYDGRAANAFAVPSHRHDLYYDTPIENLGTKFTGTPLQHTADLFLGTLIGEAVRRDLLNLSAEAKALLGDASHEIAVGWTDKFKHRNRKKGVSFRDIMQVIGADYSAYSGSKDERRKIPVDLVATMRLPRDPKQTPSLDLGSLK
jgi:hypothetical protein